MEKILKNEFQVIEIEDAKKNSASDLLSRRHLTNLLFNAGVKKRSEGDESGCLFWMKECADLLNPLIEYEWHLARHEALSPT